MIGEGFILSIVGNGIYDIIKKSADQISGNKDDDLYQRIYKALDETSKVFFKEYKDEYPHPDSSFLGREKNIDLILETFFHSRNIDLLLELDTRSFDNNSDLTDEQLNFFLDIFNEKVRKDHKLNHIIAEKKHFEETKRIEKDINNIMKLLSEQKVTTESEKPEKKKVQWDIINNDTGEKVEYVEGQKQVYSLPNGVKYVLLMKDGKIYVDFHDQYGKVHYMELDENLNVINTKFPYPLSEYKLVIDENEILNEEITHLPNGYYLKTTILKWGRESKVYYDSNHLIQKIENSGGWGMDHAKRIIYPRDS